MDSGLSYFSTIDQVIRCPDEQLQQQIGYLSPDIVTEYVFYLRKQIRSLESKNKSLSDDLVKNLKSKGRTKMFGREKSNKKTKKNRKSK